MKNVAGRWPGMRFRSVSKLPIGPGASRATTHIPSVRNALCEAQAVAEGPRVEDPELPPPKDRAT